MILVSVVLCQNPTPMTIPFWRRIPRMCKRKLYLWVPERGVEEEKIVVSSQLMSCPLVEVGGGGGGKAIPWQSCTGPESARGVGASQWRSSLRHCTTSRKVVGSIPKGTTGLFHWQSFWGHCILLTQMSTKYISWGGKGSQCVGLTT